MIIGITGDKKSGKDFVATYLASHLNYAQLPMSKPKEDILELSGVDNSNSPNNDLWHNIWTENAIKLKSNVVCPDVTTIEQAKVIKRLSGIIIKISMPEINVNYEPDIKPERIPHDLEIYNSGSFTDLINELHKEIITDLLNIRPEAA